MNNLGRFIAKTKITDLFRGSLSDTTNNQQMPAPLRSALTFVGPITYPATKFLRNSCCGAANSGVQKLTLLISSTGGSTFEGFALFNFLRALPLELEMHNIGSIDSIANVVFLAGTKRLACPTSRFLFHDFTWSYKQETLDRDHMRERAESLNADAAQFTEVFAKHTGLSESDFNRLQLLKSPTIVKPDTAKEWGIVHEIAEVRVPVGVSVFNIEY